MGYAVVAWMALPAVPRTRNDGILHPYCPRARNEFMNTFRLRHRVHQAHPAREKIARMTSTTSQSKESPAIWDGQTVNPENLISKIKFTDAGLVPAIAQQWDTGEILMMAWMNAESIRVTMKGGRAVYYSRSRKELWRKGDTSGQIQVLRDILLDCDGDTILLKVDQLGVACHTGRRSCFFTAYRPPNGESTVIADVIMDPKELYKTDGK